jgi:spore maturation protein CgeB
LPPVEPYLFIGSYFNKKGSAFIQPELAITRAKVVRFIKTAYQHTVPGAWHNKEERIFSKKGKKGCKNYFAHPKVQLASCTCTFIFGKQLMSGSIYNQTGRIFGIGFFQKALPVRFYGTFAGK